MPPPDHIDADNFSPLGDQPLLIVDASRFRTAGPPIQAMLIGLDRDGALPAIDPAPFDLLLSTHKDAPAPWVSVASARWERQLAAVDSAVKGFPFAASILAQTLRLSERLGFADALVAESLGYSTLLGGGEFRRWRASRAATSNAPDAEGEELVLIERQDDHIVLTLNQPLTRNAMTASMRDALYAALANILDDPTKPTLLLRGAGKCFSTGGSLAEFGTSTDMAEAHAARTLHSCARAIFALGDRVTVDLHGACVGSGIEIAAAAHFRRATPDAWFQLPELRMGLIPGAGGTVSVARAIGRHRTCWMVLTGYRLSSRQALDWGLVHAVEAVPCGM